VDICFQVFSDLEVNDFNLKCLIHSERSFVRMKEHVQTNFNLFSLLAKVKETNEITLLCMHVHVSMCMCVCACAHICAYVCIP
jgi:hypothetical protein